MSYINSISISISQPGKWKNFDLESSRVSKNLCDKTNQMTSSISDLKSEKKMRDLEQKKISKRKRNAGNENIKSISPTISPIKKLSKTVCFNLFSSSLTKKSAEKECSLMNLDEGNVKDSSFKVMSIFTQTLSLENSSEDSESTFPQTQMRVNSESSEEAAFVMSKCKDSESTFPQTQMRVNSESSEEATLPMSKCKDSESTFPQTQMRVNSDSSEEATLLMSTCKDSESTFPQTQMWVNSESSEEAILLMSKCEDSESASESSEAAPVIDRSNKKEAISIKNSIKGLSVNEYFDAFLNDVFPVSQGDKDFEALSFVRKRKFRSIQNQENVNCKKNELDISVKKTIAQLNFTNKVALLWPGTYKEQKQIEYRERVECRLLTLDDYCNELIGVMEKKFNVSEEELMDLFEFSPFNVKGAGWEMASARNCLDFCMNVAFDIGSCTLEDSIGDDSFDRIFDYFEDEEEWPRLLSAAFS